MGVAGLPEASRGIDAVVEMMLDATQGYGPPPTAARLFGRHGARFPTGRSGMHAITVSAWRTAESGPMRVVSGPIGRETVHVEAPEASRVDAEMRWFLEWFEAGSEVDPLIRAAVAHFWFVTIHPFEDGNGRVARAIADWALARADASTDRYCSMPSQIERKKKRCGLEPETQQHSDVDITPWIRWFVDCLERSIDAADDSSSDVLWKARAWERINAEPVSDGSST
jgi:Fic family protein